MKKYLKIFKIFVLNGFSYEAQYRKDTIIKTFINFLWIGMIFLTIEVIFSQTQTIVGWEKHQVYLITILWVISDEAFAMFFAANLGFISDEITEGQLDYILVKPINSLFMSSTKVFLARGLYRLVTWFIILAWIIYKYDFSTSLVNIFFAIVLVLLGMVLDYSLTLFANSFSFWFLRIDNINQAIDSIRNFGKYPVDVLPRALKVISFTLVPIAFISYVPVSVLTGRMGWIGILYAFAFVSIVFTIAVKFWNFAIKKYSSASS